MSSHRLLFQWALWESKSPLILDIDLFFRFLQSIIHKDANPKEKKDLLLNCIEKLAKILTLLLKKKESSWNVLNKIDRKNIKFDIV